MFGPIVSLDAESITLRNNINITGHGHQTMVLAHGFGCDQTMWRFIRPALEEHYKVVVFDYVGSGKSNLRAYDKERYLTLEGYAQDIIEICDALELEDIIYVGHSVSSIIGILASQKRPELFSKIIMVCPSPCFLNIKPDYQGGFEREDLEELMNLMEKNYIGWANYLAPLVLGQANSEELIHELSDSFCSTDPKFAKPFAMATFFSDYRHILPETSHSCLILQSANDTLAAIEVGEYMAEHIPDAELKVIDALGHCLHMTEPQKVLKSMKSFLNSWT